VAGSVGTSSSVRAAPAPSAAPLAAGCCAGPTVSRLAGISHGRTTTLCAFWMTRNCHSCSRLTFRVISGAAASKATRASWRESTTLATLPEAFSWCRGFPRRAVTLIMNYCPCTSKKVDVQLVGDSMWLAVCAVPASQSASQRTRAAAAARPAHAAGAREVPPGPRRRRRRATGTRRPPALGEAPKVLRSERSERIRRVRASLKGRVYLGGSRQR
jgi:hypothetical protein